MRVSMTGWNDRYDSSNGPIKSRRELQHVHDQLARLGERYPGSKASAAARSVALSGAYYMARPQLQQELVDLLKSLS